MKKRLLKILPLQLGLLCVCLTGIQCAVTDLDHLATTNWVDRKITPDNEVGQWLMIPVYIPTAIVTLIVDNFIIAPIVHIPSAVEDSVGFITTDMDGYYANAGLMPFKTVLTPVVFVCSWLGRILLASDTDTDAWWGWPEWGEQWQRDKHGKLIGPVLPSESNKTIEKPEESK